MAEVQVDTEGEEAGSLTITTDEGQTTYGTATSEQPDWVPVYPGTQPEGTYASETPEMRAGAYTFEARDSIDDVLGFYVSELEAAGFTIQNRTTTPDGALLVAGTADESRAVTVTLSTKGEATEAMVNFTEKK